MCVPICAFHLKSVLVLWLRTPFWNISTSVLDFSALSDKPCLFKLDPGFLLRISVLVVLVWFLFVFVLNCKFKPSVTKLIPRVLTGESFVVENFPSFWPPWALSHFRYFYMFTIILAFIALNASLGCFFLKGKVCIILTSFVLHLTQINLDFSCILIHEGLKKTLFLV